MRPGGIHGVVLFSQYGIIKVRNKKGHLQSKCKGGYYGTKKCNLYKRER